MRALNLNAARIMAMTTPEQLYTGDINTATEEYKLLRSKWHPDRPGGNAHVFDRVLKFYDEAKVKLEKGEWEIPGILLVETVEGVKYELKYETRRKFELGDMYAGPTTILYLIEPGAKDLVLRAERIVSTLRYGDASIRAEYARYMPEVVLQKTLKDGRNLVVYRKTSDVFLLRDVLDHFKGRIEPRHVGWILSRMYNILAYFRYTNVVHNALSPDNLWISPKNHSIMVFGGWWYAAKDGEKLIALPQRTLDVVPPEFVYDKKAKCIFDSFLVRSLGCELLGDLNGSKLLIDKSIPQPMKTWVRNPGTKDPVKEYMDWYNKCLIESFGERKFVEFKVSADDLYPSKFD